MQRTRMLAALTAALITAGTVSGVAVAGEHGSGGHGKGPVVSVECKDGPGKGHGEKRDDFAKIAKRYGLSPQRLEQGLMNVKRAIGEEGGKPTRDRLVALVAHEFGFSLDKAARLAKDVFADQRGGDAKGGKDGKGKPGKVLGGKDKKGGEQADQKAFAKALAAELHISQNLALQIFTALDKLSEHGGVDPHSAEFAALARKAGVSPQRFEKALIKVKMSMPGNPGKPGDTCPKPGDGGSKPGDGGSKPGDNGTKPGGDGTKTASISQN
ncbi:hypothetical protein SRB5_56770 [Streptomyces sp. RB5]|uniref:Uncharacterized protein n=1 Tax=Streptomyces smaragdinus TaxID=2585196 RepID=A0A7K0CPT2_9ACTN|nr:hypothetical protein [Streptomyces smaragdinus]MQY15495.1 hypothetical protein [Streptomyces smaragdinus]